MRRPVHTCTSFACASTRLVVVVVVVLLPLLLDPTRAARLLIDLPKIDPVASVAGVAERPLAQHCVRRACSGADTCGAACKARPEVLAQPAPGASVAMETGSAEMPVIKQVLRKRLHPSVQRGCAISRTRTRSGPSRVPYATRTAHAACQGAQRPPGAAAPSHARPALAARLRNV